MAIQYPSNTTTGTGTVITSTPPTSATTIHSTTSITPPRSPVTGRFTEHHRISPTSSPRSITRTAITLNEPIPTPRTDITTLSTIKENMTETKEMDHSDHTPLLQQQQQHQQTRTSSSIVP